jgi:hypothetical protein
LRRFKGGWPLLLPLSSSPAAVEATPVVVDLTVFVVLLLVLFSAIDFLSWPTADFLPRSGDLTNDVAAVAGGDDFSGIGFNDAFSVKVVAADFRGEMGLPDKTMTGSSSHSEMSLIPPFKLGLTGRGGGC